MLPRHTDYRIEQLCVRAKAAKSDLDIRIVLKELRGALSEHTGLARESLEAQVSALITLQAKIKEFEDAKIRECEMEESDSRAPDAA